MRKFVVFFLLLLTLTACAIGPDYKRPSVTIPNGWRIESSDAKAVANTIWWEQFNDQVLNELIQTALKGELRSQDCHSPGRRVCGTILGRTFRSFPPDLCRGRGRAAAFIRTARNTDSFLNQQPVNPLPGCLQRFLGDRCLGTDSQAYRGSKGRPSQYRRGAPCSHSHVSYLRGQCLRQPPRSG